MDRGFDRPTLVAATRIGIEPAVYLARIERGERWCWRCRAWMPTESFGAAGRVWRAAGICRACDRMRAHERRARASERKVA